MHAGGVQEMATHEIDMQADNVEEQIEEDMKNFYCSAVRFLNEEVVELYFADTELELKPFVQQMQEKPGTVSFWSKAN